VQLAAAIHWPRGRLFRRPRRHSIMGKKAYMFGIDRIDLSAK
jgi:hypothetical protein